MTPREGLSSSLRAVGEHLYRGRLVVVGAEDAAVTDVHPTHGVEVAS